MKSTKHITTILLVLIILSCSNASKKVENNNLTIADTVIQVSNIGTTTKYADNAIYVGQKINDFISLTQQRFNVRKETFQLEGDDYDIYNVYENGQKLFAIEPVSGKTDLVWRIWIHSAEVKTEKGIGVGSTLADIKTKYQIENIGMEEGLHITVEEVGVVFLMDSEKLPENWWSSMDNDKIPGNLPITAMIIWDANSYLTLEKIIKTN
jgi:hypothetical protein